MMCTVEPGAMVSDCGIVNAVPHVPQSRAAHGGVDSEHQRVVAVLGGTPEVLALL